jgi:hypothetical protein
LFYHGTITEGRLRTIDLLIEIACSVTNIVKQVSWFRSSLLLRIQNKHTYKY